MEMIKEFYMSTGLGSFQFPNMLMIVVGIIFIALAITKDYEPLLLVPIGFGIIVGNIPHPEAMAIGVYDSPAYNPELSSASVLSIIYQGVDKGLFPPLIFLGIGAMTDFSTMLSNPKLVLLGAAAQVGIFLTLIGATFIGFSGAEAAAIGIIGGADGPTAIFLSSQIAPSLLGPIAIAAYSYMALVPVIQPPIMKLLTTPEERRIHMPAPRVVSRAERIVFPMVAFIICAFLAPGAITLIGMLFFGNLLKESTVTERLANTARNALIDGVTILLGFSVGASTQAVRIVEVNGVLENKGFLTVDSIKIFALGAISFCIATASGLLFAKLMNKFLKQKINPLVGAAGVSAVPDSARVVQMVGQKEDPTNFLLMHAMAPNVSGVIGSAIAAGVLYSTFFGA